MGAQAELAVAVESPDGNDAKDQESQKQAEAQDASLQHYHQHGLRGAVSGRSFNFQKLVNGVRKSFERTPRQAEKDAPPPTMKRYFTQALWLDHQDGMHVAHAPPPGMDEAYIPPDSEDDEHEYVEHVDLKAISLAGLREFVRHHGIKPTMTTQQVVKSVIIPATMGARKNCALADTDSLSRFALPSMDSLGAAAARKAAGPAPPYTRMPKRRIPAGMKRRAPYYYVVHAWSRPFMEMVNMLEAHFTGRPAEHTYVWLDAFAVPQVSPDHSGFVQEIQRAIWYSSATLVCFDPTMAVLGRLWCLYEMFYTLISKQCAHALVALNKVPMTAAQRTSLYRKIDATKARCSVKEDKKKLLEHVQGYTRRGLPAINNYIRSGLMLPPYDHPAVYLPAGYEEKTGLLSLLPCVSPPPPPPPPPVPEHVAMVPEVAEPSVRLPPPPGADGAGAAVAAGPRQQLGHQHSHFYKERPLRLVMGACNIPHPSKTKTGGEDAFFVSGAGRGALGVADGVGSWSSDDGVDPAAYSRDLMRAAAASLEASGGKMNVRMALADAHLAVKHAGSCTGLVGLLPPDSNDLQVINLGDSGMRLVRGGRLAMATRPQSHSHNMPYQLACPDEPVCDTDATVQGDLYCIPLEAGDIIIMATDGLYDNLWPEEMLGIVNRAMSVLEEDAMLYVAAEGAAKVAAAASGAAAAAAKGTTPKLATAPSGTDSCFTATDADQISAGGGSSGETSPDRKGASASVVNGGGGSSGGGAVSAAAAKAAAAAMCSGRPEGQDGIGKHAPVAGDDGQRIRADASHQPLSPAILSTRAAGLARLLARSAAANMLRRDVRSPFAVELSKQPSASAEFRSNPKGGKPDDVTVVVAVAVEADEEALEGMAAAAAAINRALSTCASGPLAAADGGAGNSGRLPTRLPSGRLA